jgi:hypothetical protein
MRYAVASQVLTGIDGPRVAINPITQSKLFDSIELNSNRSNRSEARDNSIKSIQINFVDLIRLSSI